MTAILAANLWTHQEYMKNAMKSIYGILQTYRFTIRSGQTGHGPNTSYRGPLSTRRGVLQPAHPPKDYAAVLQNLLFLRGVGGLSSPPKTGDCDSEDAAPTLSSRPTPEKERRGQYFPEDVQIQRMAILCGVLRLLGRGGMSNIE